MPSSLDAPLTAGGDAPPADSIAVRGPAPRDLRLDVFRGLALAMIYVNHVPGTAFEYLTSRNFGFSDAAEGFVIMSGIAAGLAYSGRPPVGRPWHNVRRAWSRSWTLYMTHIVTTMMAIGISAAAARWFGVSEMLEINNLAQFFDDAIGVMIGIPTLAHQLGYFNILPLYTILIAVTPALIWLGRRSPAGLVVLSIAVWILAGETRLNLPAYPNEGGWFFNPFSWQLIFVLGLLTGMALKRGERLVPVHRGLLWAAIGWLVFVLVWRFVPPVGALGRSALHAGFDAGVPFYVVSFDKTFVAVPRLLHALAIFYVVSAVPWFRDAVEGRWARPLVLMGRHGLPVFATGSVLSILAQAIKHGAPPSFLLDAWLIVGGLTVQVGLAFVLARLALTRAPAR
jgi:hypothetical protein